MNAYIYQLPTYEHACFDRFDYVILTDKKIDLNKYEVVGYLPIPQEKAVTLIDSNDFKKYCEELFSLFNGKNKISTYEGRELNISDIIAIDGKYFYCDYIGFKELYFGEDNIYRG